MLYGDARDQQVLTITKRFPKVFHMGTIWRPASRLSSTKGGHGHYPFAHPCRRHGVSDLGVPRQGHLHSLYLVRAHSEIRMIWRTNTKR